VQLLIHFLNFTFSFYSFYPGAESISEIPTDRWTFVALVFTNHTSSTTTSNGPSDTARQQDEHQEHGLQVAYPADYYTSTATGLTAHTRAGAESAPSGCEYSIAVYLDGKLDVKVDFSQVVISNNHSAQFFNDVSFAGMFSYLRLSTKVVTNESTFQLCLFFQARRPLCPISAFGTERSLPRK